MTLPRSSEMRSVMEGIARARLEGRPVVPLVGGGVSAECGLPVVADLERYLAALKLYVHHRAFLPAGLRAGSPRFPALTQRLDAYRSGPLLQYVQDHNWPDPWEV